jgi:hypothetical protein
MPTLRLRFKTDAGTAAVCWAMILLSATGMDIGKVCEAVGRVARLVGSPLGDDRGEVLVAEMTASAMAHSH